MSKQVDRILDDVAFVFDRHYTDKEERVEFLEELIEELENLLEELNDEDDDDLCPNCLEDECDCEPEVCI